MQLTVREVSRCLKVPESTVTNWVRQRGLPAQYIAGQYRFNRVELLEWATANQVAVSLEVFQQQENTAEPIPSLAEALAEGGIVSQLPSVNKEEALRALVQFLPLPDSLDRELLLQLFLAREALASTALGGGIAIPHVRNPIVLQVARPMVTLAFLAKPVDFGALDGKPVQVLFSIISPTTRSHLQLLSRLSFVLRDEKFRSMLLRQAPREELLQEVCRVEAGLSVPPGGGGGDAAA